MTAAEVYELVNDLNADAYGKNAAMEVRDLQGLISVGDYVMSANSTEKFLNTLALRIYETIFSERLYTNQFDFTVRSAEEYGAILQKISMKLPEVQEDPTYELVNGQSVDHYKVTKPDVVQKLFYTLTPYMLPMTFQRQALKEAFLSPEAMERFISMQMVRIRTTLEKCLEDMGHATVNNFAAEIAGTSQEIKLLTMYNNAYGASLTPASAMITPDFLRFAIGKIKLYSRKLRDLTTLYNQGDIERHTPLEYQNMIMFSDFITQSETVSEYAAFNREFVSLNGYRDISYWQNSAPGNEAKIEVNRASDGTAVTIDNMIGMITDYEALGIYREAKEVATTPVNAYALYYNTVWHERQLWFNDTSENGVIFTLS